MNNIINFTNKAIELEVNKIIKENEGNGYHRIVGLIETSRALGKTEEEILNLLKSTSFKL